MTIIKNILSRKETPKPLPNVCVNCDNFYGQYIVKPDFTNLKGRQVPQMVSVNYCAIHNVSLPIIINKQGKVEVDIMNCKQFEPLKS